MGWLPAGTCADVYIPDPWPFLPSIAAGVRLYGHPATEFQTQSLAAGSSVTSIWPDLDD
jgi:hypothetical protein